MRVCTHPFHLGLLVGFKLALKHRGQKCPESFSDFGMTCGIVVDVDFKGRASGFARAA